MSRMLFVNLPVADVARATSFYEALGFSRNPRFSDGDGSCMVLYETSYVMLVSHAKWASFTTRPIPDRESSEVALAISCDSRAEVDALVEAAAGLGGTKDINPAEDHGFMYQRSILDPDGHVIEPFWMDPAALGGEPGNEEMAQ